MAHARAAVPLAALGGPPGEQASRIPRHSLSDRPAARAHARPEARWSSPGRRARAIAGWCSGRTGRARRAGPRGTPHGSRVRTDHTSRSFPPPVGSEGPLISKKRYMILFSEATGQCQHPLVQPVVRRGVGIRRDGKIFAPALQDLSAERALVRARSAAASRRSQAAASPGTPYQFRTSCLAS